MAGRSGAPWWRWPAVVALVVSAAALVWGDRGDLPTALAAVRDARPLFVLVALALVLSGLACQALLHASCQRAVGIDADAATLLAPAAAATLCNLTTKSGGMAGLVPLSAVGRRRGVAPGRIVGAYVLANAVGHVAFAATLAVAVVVLVVEHRLPLGVTAACAVFGLTTAAQIGLLSAAVASDRVVDRVHGLRAGLARRRGRPVPVRPTELDQAVSVLRSLRSRPTALLGPLGAALLIEAIGVLQLWAVLHAVGARPGIVVPLAAYAVSVLFTVVGFLPGGLGFVEAGLGGLLVSFGLPTARAAAVVVLYRICELWLPAAIGAVALRRVRRTPEGPDGRSEALVGDRAARWPGGRRWRRAGALAAIALAAVDVLLAAAHRPVVRMGGVELAIADRTHSLIRYVLLLAALALLSSVRGLLHGKRAAWAVALAAAVASLVGHGTLTHDPLRLALAGALVTILLLARTAFRPGLIPCWPVRA